MTLSDDLVSLRDGTVEVVVDVGRGADILTLRHRRTGTDVLFSTPWRAHADAIRSGTDPTTYDPVAGFLERYRGGWNTLCPNAGPPRLVHGAPVGFHGEAAVARWTVVHRATDSVRLRCALFSVPLVIERRLALGPSGSVTIEDELVNTSAVDLEIDYVSHPAFGGRLLEGGCTIETNAREFVADPETEQASPDDLLDVPADGPRMAFGWLTDFDGDPWASITNHGLGLRVRLSWDPTHLPYAWFWQELGWTAGHPWHRRARAVAIEPSSTQTGGPGRRSVLTCGAGQPVHISLSIALNETKDDT
jgi:hypothetical protein